MDKCISGQIFQVFNGVACLLFCGLDISFKSFFVFLDQGISIWYPFRSGPSIQTVVIICIYPEISNRCSYWLSVLGVCIYLSIRSCLGISCCLYCLCNSIISYRFPLCSVPSADALIIFGIEPQVPNIQILCRSIFLIIGCDQTVRLFVQLLRPCFLCGLNRIICMFVGFLKIGGYELISI